MVETIQGRNSEQKTKYKPLVLAIVGLPLHGKTTLARELARTSNFTLVDVDEVRADLFPESIVGQMLPTEQERFVMLTSYQATHERARDIVRKGDPVVIAGAYTRTIYHNMLQDLAKKTQVPLKKVLLECSEDKIRARIQKRNDTETLSNIKTFEQYASIRDRYERISGVYILNSGQRTKNVAARVQWFIQGQKI